MFKVDNICNIVNKAGGLIHPCPAHFAQGLYLHSYELTNYDMSSTVHSVTGFANLGKKQDVKVPPPPL